MFDTQRDSLHGDPDAFPAGANPAAINPQATTDIAVNFMPTLALGSASALCESA
jgi:hypothetical protein